MSYRVRRRHVIAASLGLAQFPAGAQGDAGTGSILSVHGPALLRPRGEERVAFDMSRLERLPQRTLRTTTPWYTAARDFTGPLLRDLLAAAGLPASGGTTARCTALNDYRVDVPLEDARRFDVVVARLLDGKPMSVREKGPFFVIYPFDDRPDLRTSVYFSRCIWQLKSIEVV
jgi:hypothetical protein